MKNVLLILIFGILTSCSSSRYLLTDNNRDKNYLIDYIKDLENQGMITKKPLIVIDGLALAYENLKTNKIHLSKDDIFRFDYLSKDSDVAKNIYGERGKKGVVLIRTKKSQERLPPRTPKSMTDSNILFFIGDQQVTREELQKIDPNDVESIVVIKEKEGMSKYTSEDYEGVVIITLKKENKKNK